VLQRLFVLLLLLARAACRLISYIYPSRNQELVDKLAAKKATVIGKCNAPQAAAGSVLLSVEVSRRGQGIGCFAGHEGHRHWGVCMYADAEGWQLAVCVCA
jgi:hypothetical protein